MLHPDQVRRLNGAVRVPDADDGGALLTASIRTLPIRQMQAPAPFTGTRWLVYRWYVAVDPDQPDVALASGESYLVDCGDTWLVTGTVPLR